jgi:hypothetical protein
MPFNLGRVRRSFFGGARYFFPQLSNLFFRFDSLLVSVLAYALLVHTVLQPRHFFLFLIWLAISFHNDITCTKSHVATRVLYHIPISAS